MKAEVRALFFLMAAPDAPNFPAIAIFSAGSIIGSLSGDPCAYFC
jgi:hypothetical protein